MNWREFKDNYRRNGIVLVLGAGVSVRSGISAWEGLIRDLVASKFPEDPCLFHRLRQKGLSLTAIASLLEEHTPKGRKTFVDEVRDTLYASFRVHFRAVHKGNSGRFVRFVEQGLPPRTPAGSGAPPNPTLHSVGAFCTVWEKPSQGESPYELNPLVRAVVTLNMDALLQTYVYARTHKHLLRTVDRPSARQYPDRINIYHMHGYLHFDPRHDRSKDKTDRAEQAPDAPDAVVLTEQDYYDFFNKPNGLYNFTFLYLLREYACLFIGVSMDDENIRRLLHYSKTERITDLQKKYNRVPEAIADPDERKKYQKKLRAACARHFAILAHNSRPEVDKAQQDILRPLGVTVRWVKENFSDLPEKLGELYAAAGEDWEKVY